MAIWGLVLLGGTAASAQDAPPAPAGDIEGFSQEDIQALVEAYLNNPASLPNDLPPAVRIAIYQRAHNAPAPAPAGEAP